MRLRLHTVLLAGALLSCSAAGAAAEPLAQALARVAPTANPKAIRLAVEAAACATASAGTDDAAKARRLALIDYSLPSTRARLWVFDLDRRKLLFEDLVAHGRNSGDKYARAFSNVPESLTSSLGLFRTLDAYEGDNGYSLRLAGLEPGVNDQAEARGIVMHGASYVGRGFIKTTGRLGRSHGCPAVRPEVAHAIIDALEGGQYVFAYYPDRRWLSSSSYLGCKSTPMPRVPGDAGGLLQTSGGVPSAIR
ncbi:MAG TPA: murein L,D-transpeptidase catalytic domain family protein [Nevskiaceae bacterium]|nr:murein L,D-transpeptidase catalytic domain family protein [Nevskiaceae bacterium]